MKILLEIILRTLSIIRAHTGFFSYYRNYSERLQYKNYRGWRNRLFSEKTVLSMAAAAIDGSPGPELKKIMRIGVETDKKLHLVIDTGEYTVYIKLFNNNTLGLLLRDMFRASKGFRYYCSNFEMAKRGIKVPKAVFVLERRFLFIKFSSLIATSAVENASPFRESYRKLKQNGADTSVYLKKLAGFIFMLNSRKIAHADLLGNTMVRESDGKPEIYLIDNDAVKLFNNITKFDMIKHFEGFYDFFVKKEGFAPEDWPALCKEYLELDPESFRSTEELTEHVKNRKDIKYYLKNVR